MLWENFLILTILSTVSSLQYPRDDFFEEVGSHEDFRRVPSRPQPEGRNIPEWSQFFYLRSPNRNVRPRGFSYHVTDMNHQPYPQPQPVNRRHSFYPPPEKHQQDLQTPDFSKNQPVRDSAPSSEDDRSSPEYLDSYEEKPSVESEEEPTVRSERVSENPDYQDSSDPAISKRTGPSKLIQPSDDNSDSFAPFGSRQISLENPKPEILPPLPRDPLYGVVDTYLQFPPISFRFHISPNVQVLRPSELLLNQQPRFNLEPIVSIGNSTIPYPILHGNKVRIQVVATDSKNNNNEQISTIITTKTTETEKEDVTTATSPTLTTTRSTIESNLLARLLESTTTTETTKPAETTTITTTATPTTTETTTQPKITTTKEKPEIKKLAKLEETTTAVTTTTQPTEDSTTLPPNTLMDLLFEIKTTTIPVSNSTILLNTTGSKVTEDSRSTTKIPCGDSLQTNQSSSSTSPEVSTATSVVETRVDFVTTATIAERLSSSSEILKKGDQNKNNVIFMAAENLELW